MEMTNKKKEAIEMTNNESNDSESNISRSSWIHKLTTTNKQPSINEEKVTTNSNKETNIWSWLGYNESSSSWKSLFTSNSSSNTDMQDSVIISDQPEDDQQPEEPSNPPPIKDTKKKNVVLPAFHSQFQHRHQNPSLLTKAISAIHSFFTTTPQSNPLIDTIRADPSNFGGKKIVIIGVHGWFPMKLVRSMIGEPTGTSVKFCEQMLTAAKKYFKDTFDLDIPDECITSIPLQWEGKVLERVEKLYNDVLNEWEETIKQADIVLWTTHSQGTPVSVILIKKLIENQIINVHKQSICMLGMAGISHGPFPSLKGNLLVKYFEADAARELFEFMDSNSEISKEYREAMSFILFNKVKVVLVGSMQDQVVPLYSAIMSGISHPNILRAIYVDGHIYSKNDFLIRLITFALRLLNIGLSDHGFLIHISEVLAGNLYAWEGGHSTIYEELQVFMLPLHYLFETEPIGSLEISKPSTLNIIPNQQTINKAKDKVLNKVTARLDPFQAKLRMNPFHLPWAMRGIWDDPRILNDNVLCTELSSLQELFDKWNPTSAKLKEIKFRLEPLKARL